MFFDTPSIFAWIIGILAVFFILKIFLKPIKWFLKLLFNGIFGGLMLSVINLLGGFAGIYIVVSPLASLLAGVLGIPGVLLVVTLQYLL